MDIIWSCALTMFLCNWSILVLNVPRPGSSLLRILYQKFRLLCLCLLGPEIVFQIALGQFLSAKQASARFNAAGYHEWGLRHSFYVNMGALHVKPPDFQSFPVDADQLLYLVEHKYVDLPHINEDAIKDKDKVDGLLRFITLVQAMWFIVNLVARSVQDLAISCLELSTSAWVIFCLGTTICWSKKPAEVEVIEIIKLNVSIAQVLNEGGDKAQKPYYNTPLDFISREEWAWSKLWHHGLNYLRACRLVSSTGRPVQHFGDTVTPALTGWWYTLFVFTSLSYFAVFLSGWNFSFPSSTERLLWRIAALGGPISAMGVCLSLHFCILWYPRLRKRVSGPNSSTQMTVESRMDNEANDTHVILLLEPSIPTAMQENANKTAQRTLISSQPSLSNRTNHGQSLRQKTHRIVRWFRNNSVSKDPELDCPVRLIVLTWIFGIVYCLSRGYIAVEDLMELRSLPTSTYESVDWTKFWPHV
jgi:hypothetical protein